ncbi:MAG: hypothetical protein IT342_25190 [Candidatus Melainabacteria bacterium]|nr:hypothetical protein [Candidatus Melainabacteria bacterium]
MKETFSLGSYSSGMEKALHGAVSMPLDFLASFFLYFIVLQNPRVGFRPRAVLIECRAARRKKQLRRASQVWTFENNGLRGPVRRLESALDDARGEPQSQGFLAFRLHSS